MTHQLSALLQLASPALPIGAFSYSSGLESAIELEWIVDAASAQRWIASQLQETVLRWEIPLWGALFEAWQNDGSNVPTLNAQAIAARETSELRAEHVQMGYALRRWIVDVLAETSRERRDRLNALESVSILTAHALATTVMGLSKQDGAVAYAFGFAENQVMAATKAVPLGQTVAQRMLRALTQDLSTSVQNALVAQSDTWSNAAPLAAIASMKHETQYTRLFRS
jgi:urease accessory protein